MRCTNCGVEMPDCYNYCTVCGHPTGRVVKYEACYDNADLATALAFRLGKKSYETVRFERLSSCPNCGNPVKPTDRHCKRCAEPIPTIKVRTFNTNKMSRRQLIKEQFHEDKTSICPYCGGHTVKIYRKGYNYHEAFWGTFLGFRGARYTAGMDSNEAMARCMHCGMKWRTGYDYRLIRKR